MFSNEVGLDAAGWVIALEDAKEAERIRPFLEVWLAADPSHREAFRAMKIAACFRKAARPDATAEDMRALDVAILGKSLAPPGCQ